MDAQDLASLANADAAFYSDRKTEMSNEEYDRLDSMLNGLILQDPSLAESITSRSYFATLSGYNHWAQSYTTSANLLILKELRLSTVAKFC